MLAADGAFEPLRDQYRHGTVSRKDKLVTTSRCRCSLSRMLRDRHPLGLRPGMGEGGSGGNVSLERES